MRDIQNQKRKLTWWQCQPPVPVCSSCHRTHPVKRMTVMMERLTHKNGLLTYLGQRKIINVNTVTPFRILQKVAFSVHIVHRHYCHYFSLFFLRRCSRSYAQPELGSAVFFFSFSPPVRDLPPKPKKPCVTTSPSNFLSKSPNTQIYISV